MTHDGPAPVKVWDLPTRLFHWALFAVILVSWRTAESGAMEWHYLSGIIAFGLVLFRLLWGVIGGSTSRFSHFLRPPSAAIRYLRASHQQTWSAGHNALGGYSVLAMLILLVLQVGTGLFAVDIDGLESGPLSYLISFDQGRSSAEWHETSFNALSLLIVLHVMAIVYYRVRYGRRLTGPMITGRDLQLPPGTKEMKPASPIRLLIASVICAVIALAVQSGLFL